MTTATKELVCHLLLLFLVMVVGVMMANIVANSSCEKRQGCEETSRLDTPSGQFKQRPVVPFNPVAVVFSFSEHQ